MNTGPRGPRGPRGPTALFAVLASGLVALPLYSQAPVPRTDSTGKAISFDFPGLKIGVAEYDEGPTGTTVFYFPRGVKAAADVRGGAPGTLNSDAVRLGYESAMMQAVVFSGGSWYGLAAATGVAEAIKKEKEQQGEADFIAGVLGGIIYDVGARRFSRVVPDRELAAAALHSARPGWFPLGARGAGRFAMQGIYFVLDQTAENGSRWPHSGQGGAFRQVGATKIAVFTVVNALGTIVGRDGSVLRCSRNDATKPCPSIATMMADHLRTRGTLGAQDRARDSMPGPSGNTTLTLVVTNQKLPWWALQRMAMQVHGSMSRAIQPFATEYDGDILYAVTTDEVENDKLSHIDLAVLASEVAWDAVLASVPDLPPPAASTPVPADAAMRRDLPGSWQFADGTRLRITADHDRWSAVFSGKFRVYADTGRSYPLLPIERDRVVIDGPARDLIQLERANGRVSLTLNPGPWSQRAERVP